MAGHEFARHLYIHVPFCARRCSYCDFSIAVRREVPVEEFTRALLGELDLRFPGSTPERWTVDTLYLGGGTPSRLGAGGIASLMEALRRRLRLADDAEVTIEANPDDVSSGAARVWRNACWGVVGVSRKS